MLGRFEHIVNALYIEVGLLLAGKGGIRQVFCGGRGTHGK